jgi:hypothetical protein
MIEHFSGIVISAPLTGGRIAQPQATANQHLAPAVHPVAESIGIPNGGTAAVIVGFGAILHGFRQRTGQRFSKSGGVPAGKW